MSREEKIRKLLGKEEPTSNKMSREEKIRKLLGKEEPTSDTFTDSSFTEQEAEKEVKETRPLRSNEELMELSYKEKKPSVFSKVGTGDIDDYARAVSEGLLFGFSGETEALIESFFDEGDYWDAYETNLAENDEALQKLRKQDPILAYGLEIAGGFTSGIGAYKKGADLITKVAPEITRAAGKTYATRIGAAGVVGASEGAVIGAGKSKPGERTEGAAVGAAVGAVLGSGVQTIIEPVKTAVSNVGMKSMAAKANQETKQRKIPFVPKNKLKAQSSADRKLKRLEDKISVKIHEGEELENATQKTLNSFGINNDELGTIQLNAGRTLSVQTNLTPEELAVMQAGSNDFQGINTGWIQNNLTNPIKQRIKEGLNWEPLDNWMGTVHTRIQNKSPALAHKLRTFEKNLLTEEFTKLQNVQGFAEIIEKLPLDSKKIIGTHLNNGDFTKAIQYMERAGIPQFKTELSKVQNLLQTTKKQLQTLGHEFSDKGVQYFPRMVKDYDGLVSELNRIAKNEWTTHQNRYSRKLKKSVEELTTTERHNMIDDFLRGKTLTGEGSPRFLKERTLPYTSDQIQEFYADPLSSLTAYIKRSNQHINEANFFGRAAGIKKPLDESEFDLGLDKNIKKVIDKELELGNILPEDMPLIKQLLQARFIANKEPGYGWLSAGANIGRMSALGNFRSALLQVADVGHSFYYNGIVNTLEGMMPGVSKVNLEKLGVVNTITADLTNVGTTGQWLDKFLKLSGFRTIDRFGKKTLVTGFFNNAKKTIKTEAGRNKFIKENEKFYDTERLLNRLSAGDMEDNEVLLYLFNKLADVQPITPSEYPLRYLDMPNGKIIYTLKSYSVKAVDQLRREIIKQWKAGNKKQAIINGAKFTTIVALSSATVDEARNVLRGESIDIEDITDNFVYNLIQLPTIVGTKYSLEQLERRGATGFLSSFIPPFGVLDSCLATPALTKTFGNEITEAKTRNCVSDIPVIGQIIADWKLGGAEIREKRDRTEKSKVLSLLKDEEEVYW